jgi:FkbM family methyltransferase
MNITIPGEAQREVQEIFDGEYGITLPREPHTVLDIGAHVGSFTLWARQQWPSAAITSYEPWPENAEMFRKNVGNQAQLHQRAVVGPKDFKPTIKMFRGVNSLCNSVKSDYDTTAAHIRVKCVDASKLPPAEYIKIDAEGVEVEVIEALDLRKTMALACEAHTDIDKAVIIEVMNQKGFALLSGPRNSAGCWTLKFIARRLIRDQKKLFVAVPVYGSVPSFFMESLLRLQSQLPCAMGLRILSGDSLVSRARNTLTADFLQTDCSHMLFIDSDIVFRPDHVLKLNNREEDVVGGFYPKKQQGNLAWVVNSHDHHIPTTDTGLQELRYIGTGFMRISRNAIERMIKRYGSKIRYKADPAPHRTEYDIWPVGTYNGRYLSEDWYFCQRWLDMGGKIWGDTNVWVSHWGGAVYPLETQVGEINNPKAP